MKSSILRGGSYNIWRRSDLDILKSFGSHVPHVRKLALIAQGAYIQQFRVSRKVEHEVTVEECMHCTEERKTMEKQSPLTRTS